MRVTDSSALISFFLKEPGWERLKDYLPFVTTIELAKKEIYNAVWKAVVLRGRIGEEEGYEVLKLVNDYFECCVVLKDQNKYLDAAFEIAKKSKLTIYDSLFIALALEEGELISLDNKQRSVAERLGVKVLP